MATCGRVVMVAISEESEGDTTKTALVSPDAVKASIKRRKGGKHLQGKILLTDDHAVVQHDQDSQTLYKNKKVGKYPSIRQALPDASKMTMRLGINSKLLANLAQSMGGDEIVLHIDPETLREDNRAGAILATNNKSNDVIGCIMTLRISDQFAPLGKNHALLKLNNTDCENLNFAERAKEPTPGISQEVAG